VLATAGFPVLFWIRTAYLWLIGVTICFMAIHNALDLVHKTRHRSDVHTFAVTGEVPERMSRALRWQHGLVMITFPTLAYTGFALTYPESWWAAPLLQWETSLGLRGYLHRVAATVLMASLFWHLAQVALSEKRRDRLRKQMLRWKDLRDLWQMVRYYLGLEPRPAHFGEFNYAEKIEYWAFMWGMIIMTATGLLLWFENWSLEYLPKAATDIATLIHFYEAVLATLAIIVWHLYWVIYDPLVYPMDLAWWHGRSPAARVVERGLVPEDAGGQVSDENSTRSSSPSVTQKESPSDRD
jgi:cytochrome b subunit of formate dehydrogenase